jgi:mandelate racemase
VRVPPGAVAATRRTEISAHLLGVAPAALYLEYLDHAGSILTQPVRVEAGNVVTPDRPGTGLEWNEHVVRRFIV